MAGIFTTNLCLSYFASIAVGVRLMSTDCNAVNPFVNDPDFRINLNQVDAWELALSEEDRDTPPVPLHERTTPQASAYTFENKAASRSIADSYDLHWVDDLPAPADMPAKGKSRKRQHSKTERTFASVKPAPAKRARKDLPTRSSAIGKENLPSGMTNGLDKKGANTRVVVPMKVFQYKGINEIDLRINGETIEYLCGAPVYLPDFRESIERNLHITGERDALGCLKFNRKPTEQNVENIIGMVQSKFHSSYVDIADGSVYDDAVVLERVKQVATALAGNGMSTFISRVYFQKPGEYLNNSDPYRDYLENWHYRYYTRHMWFEVELLNVLRKYYPRHGQHYVPQPPSAPTSDAAACHDDFNIAKQQQSVLPRSDFQKAILAVLENHLKQLAVPPRLTNKPDDLTRSPVEGIVAQSMYGQTRYMDEANFDELTALVQQNLRKGYSRLQAYHVVLHLAFRYALNSRYILFLEHSGSIPMTSWERDELQGNFKEIQGMLNAASQFTKTFPRMYREMISFISKTKCFQNTL